MVLLSLRLVMLSAALHIHSSKLLSHGSGEIAGAHVWKAETEMEFEEVKILLH
jgi:hypothetical protein